MLETGNVQRFPLLQNVRGFQTKQRSSASRISWKHVGQKMRASDSLCRTFWAVYLGGWKQNKWKVFHILERLRVARTTLLLA